MITNYVHLGISPNMLFPKTFENESIYLEAGRKCSEFKMYSALDLSLPKEQKIRKGAIKNLHNSGKVIRKTTAKATKKSIGRKNKIAIW